MSVKDEALAPPAAIDPARPRPEGTWVIQPHAPGLGARLREFWQHRHLVSYFGARAMEKIYARTVLGWTWVFLRPLFPLATSALIFGDFIGVASGPVPYFLFFLTGATLWNMFSSSLMWVTRSLELNRKILRRMYFPRLVLPLATLTPALVEALIYIALALFTVLYYWMADGKLHIAVGPRLLLAPLIMVCTILLALGIGLWTSVYAAAARDVRFTINYVLGFWFYLTPVIYPVSFVPERWEWLLWLNPMAPLVGAFKWSVLGIGESDAFSVFVGIAISLAVLVLGLRFFMKAEADSIDRL